MGDDKIVFWNYNKDISFEKLQTLDLEVAVSCLGAAVSIPLEEIDTYLCDEQIFCMRRTTFDEKDYLNIFRDLFFKSDRDSLYFSVVIHNKIVFNGVNRIMGTGARANTYDDSRYPKIAMILDDDFDDVYLRFTFTDHLLWASIWDISRNRANINTLENKEIYSYFESRRKIRVGRFNIELLYKQGVLVPIVSVN
jgi:hypothetical protein